MPGLVKSFACGGGRWVSERTEWIENKLHIQKYFLEFCRWKSVSKLSWKFLLCGKSLDYAFVCFREAPWKYVFFCESVQRDTKKHPPPPGEEDLELELRYILAENALILLKLTQLIKCQSSHSLGKKQLTMNAEPQLALISK